jgi:hypothetical protein
MYKYFLFIVSAMSTLYFNMTYASCVSSSAPPASCTVTQAVRMRDMQVSWPAGSGNGGAGGCQLRWWDGNSWELMGGAANSVNCDSVQPGLAVQLPGTDDWSNGGGAADPWASFSISLYRVSDSSSIMTCTNNATCAISGADNGTPLEDEDCDGIWNEAPLTCEYSSNGLFAAGSTCPEPPDGFGDCTAGSGWILDTASSTWYSECGIVEYSTATCDPGTEISGATTAYIWGGTLGGMWTHGNLGGVQCAIGNCATCWTQQGRYWKSACANNNAQIRDCDYHL